MESPPPPAGPEPEPTPSATWGPPEHATAVVDDAAESASFEQGDDSGDDGETPAVPVRRPGDLTIGWIITTAFTWAIVVVALAAIWNTSRQLGLAVWWIGPPAQAKPIVVSLLPFVLPSAMVAAAFDRIRYLPWYGLGAAAVTGAIGLVDVGTFHRLALAEVAIALAAALVSIASLSGMYRTGDPS